MKKHLILTVILAVLLVGVPAYAATPLETIKVNVNKVLEVLRDPSLKGESTKEIKKEKLRAVYYKMFDETELSKRSLSRNWKKLTPAQQEEFVRLFHQILENTYADRILAYKNEKISFDRESLITSKQAEVFTRFFTASAEIPINYRLLLVNGNWKVYDIVIENVSLVQNYRTQFNDILSKNPPEKLLETLRKKVKQS
ncbi:MAG TPA: ABC transporter substrate-binding protein [Syntrophales bacterium]|jgi:phospholipid transport system substrate-binding protein|nr:ABC transporter substrate-binding protein [Syntrophales bacterium]HPX57165.1 ABC transporter substrate-binding protein [Syntrophales bacterium]HQA82613.1 ABC transporter substrate-binding protein [Syntrophales bacterium]